MLSFPCTSAGSRPLPALSLSLLLLLGCSQGGPDVAAESLFDATRRDLGGIRVDSDYRATYRLTNTTPRPLEVVSIKTSCGCVAAETDPSAIAPGAFREIVLNLSTHGQTVLGPLVKHATIEFRSGQKVYLSLAARLESDFEVEPRRLEFSADQRTRVLSLIRRQLDPATFSRLVLVAPSDRYDVEESPAAVPDRREFRMTIKDGAAGTSLPEVYFARSPGGTALPFSTVVCTRTGPTLRPSAFVVVVANSPARPPSQKFELVDFESQPMRLTSVAPLDEQSRNLLTISFDPQADHKSFSVALAQVPAVPVSQLFVSVDFETLDRSTSGRVLLPCHVVTAGGNSPASQ